MDEQKQELTTDERLAHIEKILTQQGLPVAESTRFSQAKSLIDDVLGRMSVKGWFVFLMGVELVTDGPNGAVERIIETMLKSFVGGV